MITSTLINQPCLRVQGTLHPCTPLKSYKRLYCVSKSPRTGLVQRTHFASLHSTPRCVSSAAATQEATTEQPSTLLPSHWVDHLAHLRPGERRALNRHIPLVSKVTALEPLMQQLTDDELAAYTTKFRARLASGESLQSLLPEAFAVVREAASRVLGMRHYDVQILGGIVLAQGQVAEMATGEGKTLVAALPAYLYALSGKGVHIVTVNDYLAQRDASWIGKILTFLGLHVGVVTSEASDSQRAVGFAADVTYITAYELAFTFLQDNLAPSTDAVVRSLFNDY
jgi:preprotein translocase subunit SecA